MRPEAFEDVRGFLPSENVVAYLVVPGDLRGTTGSWKPTGTACTVPQNGGKFSTVRTSFRQVMGFASRGGVGFCSLVSVYGHPEASPVSVPAEVRPRTAAVATIGSGELRYTRGFAPGALVPTATTPRVARPPIRRRYSGGTRFGVGIVKCYFMRAVISVRDVNPYNDASWEAGSRGMSGVR